MRLSPCSQLPLTEKRRSVASQRQPSLLVGLPGLPGLEIAGWGEPRAEAWRLPTARGVMAPVGTTSELLSAAGKGSNALEQSWYGASNVDAVQAGLALTVQLPAGPPP